MFNPIPQMIQPSQHRRGAVGGTRIMAGLALILSFLAFLMAGVVMLRTGPEGGGLRANLESFRAEAGEVLSDIRARFRRGGDEEPGESVDTDETGEESAATGAETASPAQSAVPDEAGEEDGGLIELDRIREKVDEIEDKVVSEDESAGDMLDELKEDVARLKDFSREDASGMLDRIGESLTSIRKTVAEDSAEAAKRLRALSEDLVRRSREQTERLRAGSEPTPAPED